MNYPSEPLIPSQPINYIHTLHEALKHRDEEVPYSYLMGVSGEAFRFFYNRSDPEAGMNTFFHNPLRATCRALGFKYEVLYDDTYQDASKRLRDNIRDGKPSLLPFPDSCPFLVADKHAETFICQNGYRYQLNAQDLQTKWQPGGGFLELGPHGYYQFVIGEREREPKEREAALGTLRCARKLMRTRRKIRDCAIGLAAYDELIAHLNGMLNRKRKLTEQDVYQIAKWNGQPLLQCIEARKAAVEYLQLVREHFEDEELEHFDKAIAAYQKVVTLLSGVRMVLPSVSSLQSTQDTKLRARIGRVFSQMYTRFIADEQARRLHEVARIFKPACRTAIKLLKQTAGAEGTAINEIEEVLRTSEKMKM
ncbi:MAG: hypothetical protein O7E52_08865 [Candidatus Poribacteria bacterium]|nr:hypothetical protein [Candidatus Poribacteria bacterium]